MNRRFTPRDPATRDRMRRQSRRDTRPELLIRQQLHALGLRYRVDFAPLPDFKRRRADIVFTGRRVAVFVDGCFWHGCPQHGTIPRTNRAWWLAKIRANRERDHDTDRQLIAAGWAVVRVWEHEDVEEAVSRIKRVLNEER